jgi:hypothetical protein
MREPCMKVAHSIKIYAFCGKNDRYMVKTTKNDNTSDYAFNKNKKLRIFNSKNKRI